MRALSLSLSDHAASPPAGRGAGRAFARALAIALLAAGCSGADPDTDAPDTDTDAPDTDPPDTDEEEAGTARLSGTVRDADGQPVPGARVNVCRLVCRTVEAGPDGTYTHEDLKAWTASFYINPPSERDDLLAPMVTVTLAEDEDRQLDVVLPSATASAALPASAAELDLGALRLTAGRDNLTPAPLTQLPDAIQAAEIPPETRLPVEIPGEVLGFWTLAPFEAESEAGVPVVFENPGTWTEGDVYEVWAATPNGAWVDAGRVTAGADVARGDAALPTLTSVVLIRP